MSDIIIISSFLATDSLKDLKSIILKFSIQAVFYLWFIYICRY